MRKSGFSYGLSFRYQQGFYASASVYQGQVPPGYFLDARVSYRFKWYQNLLLSINVNDLNNYKYNYGSQGVEIGTPYGPEIMTGKHLWSPFPGTPLQGAQFYIKAQITF